jgi:hypothetical protein
METLKEFLVKNRAYRKFVKNLSEQDKKRLNEILNYSDIYSISEHFVWRYTEEGSDYWCNLHIKWNKQLSKSN